MAAPGMARAKGINHSVMVGAAYSLALIGILIFGGRLQWGGLSMTVEVTNLAGLLAPVVFTAAVVERAVEILISPWRDAGANALQNSAAAATAAGNTALAQGESAKLDHYKAATQKYAFCLSLVLSLLVSISGVRALGPFVKEATMGTVRADQKTFFLTLDVALTTLLLAGGADAMHSIVNAVTTFFDASTKKSSGS